MNEKQIKNLELLQTFYGMPFIFNEERKEYLCLSPSGVLLFKYTSTGGDRLFGMSCGDLLPSHLIIDSKH